MHQHPPVLTGTSRSPPPTTPHPITSASSETESWRSLNSSQMPMTSRANVSGSALLGPWPAPPAPFSLSLPEAALSRVCGVPRVRAPSAWESLQTSCETAAPSAPSAAPNYRAAFSRAPSGTHARGTNTGKTAPAGAQHHAARRGSPLQEIRHGTGNRSNASSSRARRLEGQEDPSLLRADL